MNRYLKMSSAGLAFAVVFGVQGADWNQFRGPAGNGISPDTAVPTKWGAKEGILWKTSLPGRGLSCPVIVGDILYLTACSEREGSRLHVLAFDTKTGKELWRRSILATGGTACHPTTSMAAPTPIATDKGVVALFATADLVAYSPEGDLLWCRSMVGEDPNITNQVGMASSLALHKDTVMVEMETASSSFICGVDLATGREKWRHPRGKGVNWTSPMVVKQKGVEVALFLAPNGLTACEPSTGKVLWNYSATPGGSIQSPTTDGEMIFSPGSPLVALKPAETGTTPEVAWKSNKASGTYCSPVVYQGKLYGVSSIGINCLDAATGKEVWVHRVKGPFAGSPLAVDGKIYLVTEDGTTVVLKAGTAQPEVLASNKLGETIMCTPAIANGKIFMRSDSTLWCIGNK
jgi:outer membrane protein assembly factor BamB